MKKKSKIVEEEIGDFVENEELKQKVDSNKKPRVKKQKVETYKLACIKCSTEYTDVDPDPYLCDPCKVIKNKIAKEIDAKMARIPSVKKKANWSDVEALKKERGVKARGITWLSEKDLLNL